MAPGCALAEDAGGRDRDPPADPRRVRGGRAGDRPGRRRAWLTFVVVGGGPTGVELAGQIAEIANDTLRRDFRSIDPRAARILLIEATDRLLGAFPERSSTRAARALERLGVTPVLDHTVVGGSPHAIT